MTLDTRPERQAPFDETAEQHVLGSLLIDRDAIFKIADLLSADDFYVARHQRKLLKELDESLKKGGAKHSPTEESWADKLRKDALAKLRRYDDAFSFPPSVSENQGWCHDASTLTTTGCSKAPGSDSRIACRVRPPAAGCSSISNEPGPPPRRRFSIR